MKILYHQKGILWHARSKISSCYLLLPACVRAGFLRLLQSKQTRETVFSVKMA